MVERFVVIGLATVLAIFVLVLTLLSEPSTPRVAKRTIDDPVKLDEMPTFDPNRTTTSRIDPRGQAKKYKIRSTNKRGQLVELYGDSLTPLPEGVSRVDSPGARIHFEPNRVLQIRAKEGTVLAPDNQVRSGHFDDQVVLTLFHSPPDRKLDLSDDSQDAKLNLYLDQARFDLELGRVESDKNVHLIGQNIDFSGVGLDLIYNNLRHRIDRLEIMQGKELRFTPSAQAASGSAQIANDDGPPDPIPATRDDDPSDPAQAARHEGHEPEPEHNATPTDEQSPLADMTQPRDRLQAPARIEPASDRIVQYYRARFEDGVRVRSRTATINADRLDVVFSLDAQSDQGLNLLGRGWGGKAEQVAIHHTNSITKPSVMSLPLSALGVRRPSAHGSIQGMLTQLVTLVIAQSNPEGASPASLETAVAAPPQGDEVVITWTGRLLIEPEESPPIDMTGPDDLLLVLVGRPVRITTVRHEVITAASVDYLANDGRVRMFATDPYPLEITTPNMGVLRGQRLVIHQNQGIGQIIGAGSLKTGGGTPAQATTDQSIDSLTTIADQPDRHEPLQITWNDRVDLTFFNSESAGSTAGPGSMFSQITGLKDAVFRGDVRMEHRQFALDTDMLVARFNAPSGDGRQTLDAIQAVGHALVSVHADGDTQSAQIQSDRLEVELTHDDASIQPTSLIAVGHVVARQAQRSMHAGRLELAIDAQPQTASSLEAAPLSWDTVAPPPAPLSLAAAQPILKPIGVLDPMFELSSPLDTLDTDNAQPLTHLDALSSWIDADAWSDFDVLGTPDHSALLPTTAVQVTPLVTKPDVSDDTARSDRFVVSRMTARDDVRVHLNDLGVRVTADRLEADAQGDQIEFFGHDDQPARVERFDGALTGNHIIMNQAGQTVHVTGPGTITFINTPLNPAQPLPEDLPPPITDQPLADQQVAAVDQSTDTGEPIQPPAPPAITAVRPDDQGMRVTVTWADAMHFDNRFGLAQFLGDVVSEAQTDRETTLLSAQDLRLEFTELPETFSTTPTTDDPLANRSLDSFTSTDRSVRLVTAQQDVVFQATKWSDEPGGPFETRVHLAGPLMSFDNVAEQFQVIGPGSMLIEDYRVRSKRRKHDQRATSLFGSERTGQAKFTGRGATLLKWRNQLSFDAYHNDMRADTGVQMIHRSLDSQLTVQVDCQRLLGDLESTGGLGVWVAGHAPQPRLKAVYADENVRIISDDRTIRTDHLEYTGFDETVLLRADQGRLTEIHEHSPPTALTAERFRWYLRENRLEIVKLGPTRMSLTPTE